MNLRSPRWLWFWRFSIVFGIGMLAWNAWFVVDRLSGPDPLSPLAVIQVVLQVGVAVCLIAQGWLLLRADRRT